MPSTPTYDERVRRGGALLDQGGTSWLWSVRPRQLSVVSCRRCVLGQVFGSFLVGLRRLGLGSREAQECGFMVDTTGMGLVAEMLEPLRLNHAWRVYIKERREQARVRDAG